MPEDGLLGATVAVRVTVVGSMPFSVTTLDASEMTSSRSGSSTDVVVGPAVLLDALVEALLEHAESPDIVSPASRSSAV